MWISLPWSLEHNERQNFPIMNGNGSKLADPYSGDVGG